MRLAMKPGVSLQRTTPLPSLMSHKAVSSAAASGRVSGPTTSSSSRM